MADREEGEERYEEVRKDRHDCRHLYLVRYPDPKGSVVVIRDIHQIVRLDLQGQGQGNGNVECGTFAASLGEHFTSHLVLRKGDRLIRSTHYYSITMLVQTLA